MAPRHRPANTALDTSAQAGKFLDVAFGERRAAEGGRGSDWNVFSYGLGSLWVSAGMAMRT
jgi:hypothetical protein